MNPDVLRTGQKVLNVTWVVLILSFFVPMAGLNGLLQMVAIAMLAAHLVEFAIFGRKLEAAGGSMGQHFWKTLVYGFFHIKRVEAEAGEAGAAS